MADNLQPDQSTAMLQMAMNQPVFGNVKMPPMPMADLQAMYGMMAKDQAARAGQQISGGVPYQTAMAQAQIKQQQAANQLQNSLMMAKLFPGSQMNTAGMQQSANTLMGGQNPLLQGLGFPAGQGQAPTMPTGSMGQAQAQGTLDMLKTFMQPGAVSPTTTSQDPSSVDPATGGMSQADASYYAGVPRRPGSMTDNQQTLQNKNIGNALTTIQTGLIAGPNGPEQAGSRAKMEWYLAATGKDTTNPKVQAALDKKYPFDGVSGSSSMSGTGGNSLSPAQLTAALAAIRAQIAAKDPKAAKGISDAHIQSSQAYQNYIANLAQQTSAEEQAASSEPTEDK